jgi:phosphoglycerate kinase
MNAGTLGLSTTAAMAALASTQGSSASGAISSDGMPSGLKSVDDLDLEGKRVFIRADLNVPIQDGEITDDTRIRAAMPTLKYVLDRGGIPIMGSHLGRPKGNVDPKFSLEPVWRWIGQHLGDTPVIIANDCVGDDVEARAEMLSPGQMMGLENFRFHKGETENDPEFARKLAELASVYINDAFGTAHRAHASTVGMVEHFIDRGAGLLMARELSELTRLLVRPARPFVSVLGGAKVSDKIGVIKNLMETSDAILIGGAMAYTFLLARGIKVGHSKVEEFRVHDAAEIMKMAEEIGTRLYLPRDHRAGSEETLSLAIEVDSPAIPAKLVGYDIGPKTVAAFSSVIKGSPAFGGARTVFWNGPMGWFENAQFATGTKEIAAAIAESSAYSVIGGGDSVAAINQAGLADRIGHISTGGGAMLAFVGGKELPGVQALK